MFFSRTEHVSIKGESPFFLLYGRDPRLPTETVLSPPRDPQLWDLDDYKSVLVREMGSAWGLTQESIKKAQKRKKTVLRQVREEFKVFCRDRVFVCMPAKKTGHMRKLACPFQGPYRVLEVYTNGLDLRPVDKPGAQPIRVAMDRIRRCPSEIGGVGDNGRATPDQS